LVRNNPFALGGLKNWKNLFIKKPRLYV